MYKFKIFTQLEVCFCPIIYFMYCVTLMLIIQVTYSGQSNICCVFKFSFETVFQWLIWGTYNHKKQSQLFLIFVQHWPRYLHFASMFIPDLWLCCLYSKLVSRPNDLIGFIQFNCWYWLSLIKGNKNMVRRPGYTKQFLFIETVV